ncbi:MAG: GIY-YIG nuclease family protein [Candidatus Bathyarchaeia archaeon]
MRSGKRDSYYVYILLCADGSYYTGYSNNPANRFIEHSKGRGARYTKMHKPNGIAYLQSLKTRRAAMRRERQIKTFTHEQKRNLIENTAHGEVREK